MNQLVMLSTEQVAIIEKAIEMYKDYLRMDYAEVLVKPNLKEKDEASTKYYEDRYQCNQIITIMQEAGELVKIA